MVPPVVALNLAPRVLTYPQGSRPPGPEPGVLALAQIPRSSSEAAVFGDGSHPTTRLCAGALDLLCRQHAPRAALDVGTGTGVLARIARARGAAFVAATDLDPVALACARAHAELDAHPLAIHFGAEAPDHWGARFDVVIANILGPPLQQLAAALSRAVSPSGVLLLSGFTPLETPALRVSYRSAGMTVRSEAHLHDWALLRLEHG
jgi:ribosomal protein L11 methyltransferase